MSETQVLLTKIAALRERLDQVQAFVRDPGSMNPHAGAGDHPAGQLRTLESRITMAEQQGSLLDATLRQLGEPLIPDRLPARLTVHARTLLERTQDILGRLRQLAADFDLIATFGRGLAPDAEARWTEESDPLASWFRQTVAMTDALLRMLSALPDSASGQLRLWPGLQGILDVIVRNVEGLSETLQARRHQVLRIDKLADLLTALESNHALLLRDWQDLAEELLDDALEASPLQLVHAPAEQPVRFIACHSLVVAQVMARVARSPAPGYPPRQEAVVAALLHDVGMLRVPVEILTRPGALNDMERRVIEAHPTIGAEIVARAVPAEARLREAILQHHERLDGTGYPSGLQGAQLGLLGRLLAVCDFYAALCGPRPYRPARETRTALADTLLLADQGMLDRDAAERLLQLSFYPVGTVVELADGAVGVVVAAPILHPDLSTPARPVVALLTDAEANPLPSPRHVDLAHCEGRSIVRTLPAAERRAILGKRYPELAA